MASVTTTLEIMGAATGNRRITGRAIIKGRYTSQSSMVVSVMRLENYDDQRIG